MAVGVFGCRCYDSHNCAPEKTVVHVLQYKCYGDTNNHNWCLCTCTATITATVTATITDTLCAVYEY